MAAAFEEAAVNRVWPSQWQRPQHFALGDDNGSRASSKQRKLRADPWWNLDCDSKTSGGCKNGARSIRSTDPELAAAITALSAEWEALLDEALTLLDTDGGGGPVGHPSNPNAFSTEAEGITSQGTH